jgi:hypothetical protein
MTRSGQQPFLSPCLACRLVCLRPLVGSVRRFVGHVPPSFAGTSRESYSQTDHSSVVHSDLAACVGGPYTYPTQSTPSIDASKGPVVFKWDPSCLSGITNLDLSLYAYSLDAPVIKVSHSFPEREGRRSW